MLEYRDIRLDIEKWRPIQDIKIDDVQRGSVDSHKPHRGDSNWVRSPRRPRSEKAPFPLIKKWSDCKSVATRAVKVIEQSNVTESIEVPQAFHVLWEDSHGPLNPSAESRLNWDPLRIGKRGANNSNRPVFNRLVRHRTSIIPYENGRHDEVSDACSWGTSPAASLRNNKVEAHIREGLPLPFQGNALADPTRTEMVHASLGVENSSESLLQRLSEGKLGDGRVLNPYAGKVAHGDLTFRFTPRLLSKD